MKKNYIFVIIFFLSLFLKDNVYSNNNVSFVDINYIYNNSNVGKKIKSELDSRLEKLNQEFINSKKILEEEKDKINNQRNIISEEEFKKKTLELEKKVKNFNEEIAKKRKDYDDFKKETYTLFLKRIMNLVKEYANENSINLVLKKENIILGKKDFDISENVLKLVNSEIKSIK